MWKGTYKMKTFDELFDTKKRALINQVVAYTNDKLTKEAKYFDETGEFPQEFLSPLLEQNVFSFLLSNDKLDLAVFLEIIRIISKKFASLASILLTQGFYAIHPLNKFGTKEQKEKYLGELVSGKKIGAFGLSEESDDSHFNPELKTIAWETDDGWEISGRKKYLSDAPIADVFFIVAKVQRLNNSVDTGIFIIDRNQEGLVVNEPMNKMGVRSLPVASVDLNKVKLDRNSLLGGVTKGSHQVKSVLNLMKLAVSLQALGISQGSFEKGMDYLCLVRKFGNRLIDNQDIQYKMADLRASIYSAEAFTRQIILTDPQNTVDVAMAKLLTANVAIETTETVIQLTGGYGYMKDSEIERYVRDAKITAIYGGSSRSQKETIAKHWIDNRGEKYSGN